MNDEDDILCGTLETSPGRAASYLHPRTFTEWRAGWDTAHLANSRIKNVSYLAAYYKYDKVPANLEDHQQNPPSGKNSHDEAPWAWVKWRRDAETGVVVGGLPLKGYGLAGMAPLKVKLNGAAQGSAPGTPLRAPSCAGSVRANSVSSHRSALQAPAVGHESFHGPVGVRTSSSASSRRPVVQEMIPSKSPRKRNAAAKETKADLGPDPEVCTNAGRADLRTDDIPLLASQRTTGRAEKPSSSERAEDVAALTSAEQTSIGLPKKGSSTAQVSTTPRTSRQSGLWRGAWRSSTLRCKNPAAMTTL